MAGAELGFHHATVRNARLLHQKKHRQQQRCFLVEGAQVLEEALAGNARIERVFALPGAISEHLAGSLRTAGAEIHDVDRRTIESLAQTQTPQPVVGVIRFLHRDIAELERLVPREAAASVLVLPDLADPGNAGTLIRSAAAFGANAVCVGAHAVEPYNDKVVRASIGALFRVPLLVYDDWLSFARHARAADLAIVGTAAEGSDVRSVTLPQRAALLVGQERRGLAGIPAEDLNLVVSVPQAPGIESLNASVAGSIVLYELARSHGLAGRAARENK
ncbi:MAG TPA: RNA methyltransferase [Candidatus Acidoferrales bacterium]|nr:RNA methyltransferase [Candidatus Acidoferrales bacterium]